MTEYLNGSDLLHLEENINEIVSTLKMILNKVKSQINQLKKYSVVYKTYSVLKRSHQIHLLTLVKTKVCWSIKKISYLPRLKQKPPKRKEREPSWLINSNWLKQSILPHILYKIHICLSSAPEHTTFNVSLLSVFFLSIQVGTGVATIKVVFRVWCTRCKPNFPLVFLLLLNISFLCNWNIQIFKVFVTFYYKSDLSVYLRKRTMAHFFPF